MKKLVLLMLVAFSFTLFAADKAKTVSLSVTGMTCEACASTVTKALKKVDGVSDVKVDLKKNTATVTLAKAGTSSATLIKAVSDAGFNASEGKAGAKVEKKKMMKKMDGECEDDGSCDCKEMGHKKEAKKS